MFKHFHKAKPAIMFNRSSEISINGSRNGLLLFSIQKQLCNCSERSSASQLPRQKQLPTQQNEGRTLGDKD